MQTLMISGYLSRDAEKSQTRDGTDVTRWNIPVRQFANGNEGTVWYRVSIWGKRAEFAARARKGDYAAVTGDLTVGEYEGKPQYEIRASDISFVTPQPRDDRERSARNDRQQAQGRAQSAREELDDEVPW